LSQAPLQLSISKISSIKSSSSSTTLKTSYIDVSNDLCAIEVDSEDLISFNDTETEIMKEKKGSERDEQKLVNSQAPPCHHDKQKNFLYARFTNDVKIR